MNIKISKFLAIGAFSILGLAGLPQDVQAAYGSTAMEATSQPGDILLKEPNAVPAQITSAKVIIDVSDTVKAEKNLKNLTRFHTLEKWLNNGSQQGFIPSDLTIKYKDIYSLQKSGVELGSSDSANGCIVSVAGRDFEERFSDFFENSLVSKNITLNKEQSGLLFEVAIFHEIGHCMLQEAGYKDRLDIGNDVANKTIKTFFDDVNHDHYKQPSTEKEISPLGLFNEKFADVYSAMLLIRKNGLTNDVLQVLNYHQLGRTEVANKVKLEYNMPLESHSTGFALKEILKTENLAVVLNKKSTQEDYINLAVDISNKSLAKTLASYNFVGSQTFSLNQIEFKARAYLFDNILLSIGHTDNIHASNSPLKDIGYSVFEEVNSKYNLRQLKIGDLEKFYEDNRDDIKAITRKYTNEYIEKFKLFYQSRA